MKLISQTIFTLVFLLSLATAVFADKYSSLWQEFDAQAVTAQEKRFLQAALAFEGYYRGLLDGKWGSLSQDAFRNYSSEEFDSQPLRWHMAMLAYAFFEQNDQDGWQIRYNEKLDLSFLFPEKTNVRGKYSDYFVNWEHSKSSLKYSFAVGNLARTTRLHAYTLEQHELATPAYTVRKKGFAVSSSTRRDGSTLYTRSNYTNGAWSTIMLSADKPDANILQAVASSIVVGFRPILVFPENGEIARSIKLTLELVDEKDAEVSVGSNAGKATKAERRSSGSGFYVSDDGKVMTNAHVVQDCSRIEIGGELAVLVNSSEAFDLAVLQAKLPVTSTVAEFATSPAKLNSDITVAGYPLDGLLSGLNVTRGSVSSLKGILGDGLRMQISAPVQLGNSGGPVVDGSGAIVGVVVSKLNALQLADLIGDIPQNVNFAIRGEIAKLFLFQNGVSPVLAENGPDISAVDLADRVAGFTVSISCIAR